VDAAAAAEFNRFATAAPFCDTMIRSEFPVRLKPAQLGTWFHEFLRIEEAAHDHHHQTARH
jgi:hypothetical protein